jgi:hypothetical protein
MEMLDTPSWRWGLSTHRVDNGDPRDRCCVDGFRRGEGTRPTRKPPAIVVESSRDPDLYKRGHWIGIRRSAWNRMWDLVKRIETRRVWFSPFPLQPKQN